MPETYRSIRLDVGERGEEYVQKYISEWLIKNHSKIPKACIAFEISGEVKKPHFQGVLVTTETPKRFSDLISHFNSWGPNEKSFAICRKPESYLKYIKKDGDIRYYQGFTQEDIESWGDWIKITKEDKKVCHREQFYKDFLDFCRKNPECENRKYRLEWIARQLYTFLGKCPRSEQTAFCKGIIFSAQTVLLHGEESEDADKAIDRWIQSIL